MSFNKIYPYAVAAVRSMENKLLSRDRLLAIADAKTYEEALKILSDTDYAKGKSFEGYSFEKSITEHLNEVYTSVSALMGDESFIDIFLYKNDYHNLKVLIKSELSGKSAEGLLLQGGTTDIEKLKVAFRERNFNELSNLETKAINEAFELYNKTKNARYIDFVMDKACFVSIKKAADKTKLSYLTDYVTKLADATNLKTLYRISAFKLDTDIMENAYVEGGRLGLEFFKKAINEGIGIEAVKETEYKSVMDNGASSSFEKNLDDYIMNHMKDAKYKSLTAEPIIAYVFAKENEAKILRMVLSCKKNGIDAEVIKERVRETYV